jgi:hypothetical protein
MCLILLVPLTLQPYYYQTLVDGVITCVPAAVVGAVGTITCVAIICQPIATLLLLDASAAVVGSVCASS